jgi:hypothetical protein
MPQKLPMPFSISRHSMVRPLLATLATATSLWAIPAAVFAQSQSCEVLISITNPTTANAIQIEIDHSAAQPGGFSKFDCTVTGAPPALATVNTDGDTVEIAWAHPTVAFNGPSVFASCQFFPSVPPATLDAGDFVPSVVDCSLGNPPVPCSPNVSVSVGACSTVEPVCGNFAPEIGEPCDEGPTGDATCTAKCTPSGGCSDLPLPGCRTGLPGRSKLQIKDNVKDSADNAKDQGRFDWKSGAATMASDFGDPVTGLPTYHWCVYDDGELVLGAEIPGGGVCAGKPCWKNAGSTGFQYKSKGGDADGVGQMKLKAGGDGKASIGVKAKSKLGLFAAPKSLPLTGPVRSQVVVENGPSLVCFETEFTSPSKNEPKQYSAKGP